MVKVSIEKCNSFAPNNIIKCCFIICLCFIACDDCYALPMGKLKSIEIFFNKLFIGYTSVVVIKEISKRSAQNNIPDMKPWIEMGAKYSVLGKYKCQ